MVSHGSETPFPQWFWLGRRTIAANSGDWVNGLDCGAPKTQIRYRYSDGGSNGARRRTWKTELQAQLADSLGLSLTVAHYPTGRFQMESQ